MHLVWTRCDGGTTYHLGIYSSESRALWWISEWGRKRFEGKDLNYTTNEMRPQWKSVTIQECGQPKVLEVFYITELSVDAEIPIDAWDMK